MLKSAQADVPLSWEEFVLLVLLLHETQLGQTNITHLQENLQGQQLNDHFDIDFNAQQWRVSREKIENEFIYVYEHSKKKQTDFYIVLQQHRDTYTPTYQQNVNEKIKQRLEAIDEKMQNDKKGTKYKVFAFGHDTAAFALYNALIHEDIRTKINKVLLHNMSTPEDVTEQNLTSLPDDLNVVHLRAQGDAATVISFALPYVGTYLTYNFVDCQDEAAGTEDQGKKKTAMKGAHAIPYDSLLNHYYKPDCVEFEDDTDLTTRFARAFPNFINIIGSNLNMEQVQQMIQSDQLLLAQINQEETKLKNEGNVDGNETDATFFQDLQSLGDTVVNQLGTLELKLDESR